MPFFFVSIILVACCSVQTVSTIPQASSPYFSLSHIGQIDTIGQAHDVIILDDVAFVSDMGLDTDTTGGLYIFNVSDPTHPSQLSHFYDGGRSHQIALYNDTILLIADNTGGLEIFDVSNLTHPVKIGNFIGANYLNGVVIRNTTAFVTSFNSGLVVVDFSNFSSPVEISRFPLSNKQSIALFNDFAFVSGIGGFIILNITNLSAITLVKSFNYDISDFFINQTTIYAACSGSLLTQAQGFKILDFSDSMNITEIGSFNNGGHPVGLSFYNSFAFIADHDKGIEVFDVSDPTNISLITSYFDGGNAFNVVIKNDLVFVADGTDGLEILNLTLIPEYFSSTTSYTSSQAISGFSYVILLSLLVVVYIKKRMN